MTPLLRAPAVRLGAAVTPRGVVVCAPRGRDEAGVRQWTRAVPDTADVAALPRLLGEALADALRTAREALGAERARVSVALLPPLAECRFVELPGLRDDEVQHVLGRDTAAYFPVGAAAHVVGAARVEGADRDARLLAGAAPAELAAAVHDAVVAAGGTVERIVPAGVAWASMVEQRWMLPPGGACTLVVLLDGRTEILAIAGGQLRGLRRVPSAPDHRWVLGAVEAESSRRETADERGGTRERGETPLRVFPRSSAVDHVFIEHPVAIVGDAAAVASLAPLLEARGLTLLASRGDGEPLDAAALAAAAVLNVGRGPLLVPGRLREERRRSALRGAARRGALAGLLLAVAALTELWGTRRELAAVTAHRAALRAQLGGVLATRDTVAMLGERLAALRAAESDAPRWSAAIALVARTLPRDAWLLSLTGEGDSLVVEGVARRAAPVFEAFRRDPAVLAVRAQGSIRQEVRDDGQVERFTLSIHLMPETLRARAAGAPTAIRPAAGPGGTP